MALFESYERRIDKINGVLAQYGIGSVEECRDICKARGFDPYEIVKEIQPICFENACWAYTVGAAIALKSGVKTAAEAAKMIGVGLQSFCIDGSVADDRKVGLGHGNLGAMLLSDDTECFAFLAPYEDQADENISVGFNKNVTLEDGVYTIRIRYRAPSATVNTVDMYINNTKVGTPEFAQTDNDNTVWNTALMSVSLRKGANTFELKANSSGAGDLYLSSNISYCIVCHI